MFGCGLSRLRMVFGRLVWLELFIFYCPVLLWAYVWAVFTLRIMPG